MPGKEHTFYGIVTDIGEEKRGSRSNFRPITASDGQGDELKFLLFDNQENELEMVEESYENGMTLEFTYTENRKDGKTYTNIVNGGIQWADDANAVNPDDAEEQKEKSKGKTASKAIAQRKGKESFEPAINQQKQADIRQSVALQETGDTFRAVIREKTMLSLDDIILLYPSFKDSLDAYFSYITVNLTLRKPNLVEVAKEVMGAVEESRQTLSKPTKKQLDAIQRLLADQVDMAPDDIDLKAAAIARFGKGVKMTGDDARDWLHELQVAKDGPPPEDPAEESPF